jgi:hypothetical protein
VSGNPGPLSVDLTGTAMSALVRAIPATEALTSRPVIIVGGLAVICRLARPYRATSDLDTVNRRRGDEPRQLEVLIANGAQPSGVSGALVPTADGPVQVDILEVSDADLSQLPDDPTDRLHVLSHAWAAQTATLLRLRADDQDPVTAAVAEPGPLIAMKLQSVMNRGRDKEATDLLDIIQLTLDHTTGPAARAALPAAESQLRADAALHADMWFRARVDRTLRLVRGVPEGADLTRDDLDLVGELLATSLRATTT